MDRHIISILVENKFGVLARVAGLISRRGFNIESLTVGPTEDENMSRMTVVVLADDVAFEQIEKQLNKLVSVYKITEMEQDNSITRELELIKVNAPAEKRGEIAELAGIFHARIVDVGKTSMTIEATGDADKLANMEDLLRGYGVKEITRTGKIAMRRGSSRD